ncbi:hypothetical protein EVAR_13904_1 [Eumeta japonica]|uniref:Transmembrane protein n=1 Tax=Eumeta variegata TaxID=151549 RepID=A0A4C1U9M4_EUMVA|nr:hypothetical protein EVAR_13904_1 [Eumeta japonica]
MRGIGTEIIDRDMKWEGEEEESESANEGEKRTGVESGGEMRYKKDRLVLHVYCSVLALVVCSLLIIFTLQNHKLKMKTVILLLSLIAMAYAQGDRVIDPGFYRPSNPSPPFVIPNPDPFFSQPHGINVDIGPAYVDGSHYGGLRPTRPGQQNKCTCTLQYVNI